MTRDDRRLLGALGALILLLALGGAGLSALSGYLDLSVFSRGYLTSRHG